MGRHNRNRQNKHTLRHYYLPLKLNVAFIEQTRILLTKNAFIQTYKLNRRFFNRR